MKERRKQTQDTESKKGKEKKIYPDNIHVQCTLTKELKLIQ